MAKHLCGCATDYALRSIVASGAADADGAAAQPVSGGGGASMSAVVIATCCHHKCTWSSYVNRPFLEALGVGEEDFALLTLLSSWATEANDVGEERGANAVEPEGGAFAGPQGDEDDEGEHLETQHPQAAQLGLGLSRAERKSVGRMCKQLIDTGRLRFLEANGYAGRLQAYVGEDVSPENVLLIAKAVARGE